MKRVIKMKIHKVTDKAEDSIRGGVEGTLDKAYDATSGLTSHVQDLATTVGDMTRHTVEQASEKVSEAVHAGKEYFSNHSLKDMGAEIPSLIRKYPIPALLIGLGVGAYLTRSNRRGR
jgi:hypothetical protein